MILHDSQSSKQCDLDLQDRWGVQTLQLMEIAGAAVVDEILKDFTDNYPLRVFVFCGPGNNGGDGFVVSRLLYAKQWKVHTYILSDIASYRDAAKSNAEIVQQIASNNNAYLLKLQPTIDMVTADFDKYQPDLVIDAIFGVGIRSMVSGYYADIIQTINRLSRKTYAIDIPSGIHADSGILMQNAICAQKTITFSTAKIGHCIYPGRKLSGELVVRAIGIPDELCERHQKAVTYFNPHELKDYLPKRNEDSHKGNFGSVFVAGGSANYRGALSMCIKASYLSGTGKVFALYPSEQACYFSMLPDECIHKLLPSNNATALAEALMQELSNGYDTSQVLCLGPGIGRNEIVQDMIKQVYLCWKGNILIDADGLYALRDLIHQFPHPGRLILTPHLGEMSCLTGATVDSIKRDLPGISKHYAQAWNCTLVLKSATTLIADKDYPVFINTFGNSGMATAGTGDILAGLISGLIAQKMTFYQAAVLAVSIHGMAGNLAASEKTPWSLCATDLLQYIPKAIQKIL